MLFNEENIALRNLQISYYARENAPLSAQIWCIFPRVIKNNTKFANFAGLHFPHFRAFRGQTLQFY
jgi:hypothetical protein